MRIGWMAAMAAALMVPGVAQAEDWVVVSMTDDGSGVMLVDADAMTSAGGSIRKVRLFGVISQDSEGFSGALGEMLFDCKARTRKAEAIWAYRLDGTTGPRETESQWSPVAVDTVYYHTMQVACGEQPLDGRHLGPGVPIRKARAMLAEQGK